MSSINAEYASSGIMAPAISREFKKAYEKLTGTNSSRNNDTISISDEARMMGGTWPSWMAELSPSWDNDFLSGEKNTLCNNILTSYANALRDHNLLGEGGFVGKLPQGIDDSEVKATFYKYMSEAEAGAVELAKRGIKT